MIPPLYRMLFGTLRRQLMVSVAVVHALMMTLFVWDLIARQQVLIKDRQAEQAVDLANALATSAAGWLASDDLSGLQELVDAQKRHPELTFAMLLDDQGKILAHTDRSRLGLYVRDLPAEIRQIALRQGPASIDVAVPAMLGNEHVGWARVGIGQRLAAQELRAATRKGIFYALMAIASGSLLAWFLGRRITRRLHAIQTAMGQVRAGNIEARASLTGIDEAASMSRDFNLMLDMLAEQREELSLSRKALIESEHLFRSLAQVATVGIFRTDAEGNCLYVNVRWSEIVGLSMDEASGQGWQKGLYAEDRERVAAEWSQAVLEQRPFDLEYRFQRPDGAIRWVMGRSVAEIGADGAVSGHVGTITDISDRKKAEELLLYRTTLLTGLLDSIPDIIFFKDAAGVYLGCNPEFCRFVGRSQQEIIGRTDYDLFPREVAEFFREQDRIMMAQAMPRCNEEWVDYADGRRVLLETVKAPLRDARGNELGLLGVSRDITDRKRMEDSLRENEQLLKDAQQMAKLGSWVLDLRTNDLTWSDEVYAIFELDPKAFGATYEAFLNAIHPEDREFVNQTYSDSVARHAPYSIEHRLLMADGRVKIVGERGETSYDEEGVPIRSIGTVQDITDRKQVEEKLRESEERVKLALQSANQGLYDLNLISGETIVSPEYATMLGYDPEEFHESTANWIARMHPDDQAVTAAHFRDYVAGKTPEYKVEYRQLTKDGAWKWVLSLGRIVAYDHDGKAVRMLGTHTDISDRKQAELSLLRLNEELEQRVQERTLALEGKNIELREANSQMQGLDRLKSMFIASMSHELRTPLNSIIGFSSVLLEEWLGALNPEQKAKLAIVLKAGRHLLSLVNDVIDVSKIEAGNIEVLEEEFDVRDVVNEAVSLLRGDIEDKGITLEVDAPPLTISNDRRRLMQCLVNLLGNACKFTEAGTITVASSRDGGNGQGAERVTITVSDTGIGIKEEDLATLFTAFGRIPSSLDTFVRGTGLGLYLVKKITTEILKGEVRAQSRLGEGSSFTLDIPVRRG